MESLMTQHLPSEMWLPAPGFDGYYEVSSLGRVRRSGHPNKGARVGHVLKPGATSGGRQMVVLRKDGKSHAKLVSRLVCEAFHGPPPCDRPQAAHGDGNVLNNAAQNLRWASAVENMADTIAHGTRSWGSKRPLAKLSEADIVAIRNDCRYGHQIAGDYGVCRQLIDGIRNGKRWKHVGHQ